jgi:BirA family biotin operon repressor/biotin-[acetyl-CoA-carboxylase] ligase
LDDAISSRDRLRGFPPPASSFDRALYESRLRTRRLGRSLLARAEAESTNDAAWDALGEGMPDGFVVVADVQSAGRGRQGRSWHHAPGKGLALSVLLHQGCDRRQFGTLSLVAGLALARALERFGADAELKWPNDLLLAGRKVSGILAESRANPRGGDAAVIGTGVNVLQQPEDFPAELAHLATSLAIEGVRASREEISAEYLNALEPLWAELQEGDRGAVLEAWKKRAGFWGRELRVSSPAGVVVGVARDLDSNGGLVLEQADGSRVAVVAGDAEFAPAKQSGS